DRPDEVVGLIGSEALELESGRAMTGEGRLELGPCGLRAGDGPAGGDDGHAVARSQTRNDVRETAQGRGVRPVQVVEDDEEATVARRFANRPGDGGMGREGTLGDGTLAATLGPET